MSFVMLLPSDDEELEQRTAELAHWCQGFTASALPAQTIRQR
jgi:uncharacterized protein YgfB (UPF0149 family)